jgi:hypothetical protein
MSEPIPCPPVRVVYYCPPAGARGEPVPLGTYTGRIEHDMGGVVPTVRAQIENPPLYERVDAVVPLAPAAWFMLSAVIAIATLAVIWRKR